MAIREGGIAVLVRAYETGRVDVEAWKQIRENSPRLAKVICEGMKMSIASVSIIARDGRLTVRKIEEALR